jgi:hypothetical protein
VRKHDGLPFAPIFVENLYPVFGGDVHGFPPLLAETSDLTPTHYIAHIVAMRALM